MTSLFLLDGARRVEPTTPVLRADDLGVLRGESVFETLRVTGGRPAFLDVHLVRLARSAERVAIELPEGWAELAARAAEGVDDGVLRLVCSKGAPGGGPVGFALVTDVPAEVVAARESGVRVLTLTLGVTADARARAPWLLGGVKSTSYAVNMATIRHAQHEGADDAIWVSADGQVLEAPTATVAVVEGDVLVSPPDEVGVLPGTTLAAVEGLGLVPVVRRRVTLEELRAADEVLLMSSVRGVASVISVDGVPRAAGPVGALLRDALEDAVRRG